MSVKIGVSNFVYTKLSKDDSSGVTYGEITPVPGLVSIDVKPGADIGTFFADNGPYEVATNLGEISIDLELASLPQEVAADLCGHTVTAGVVHYSADDIPPDVAVGFVGLKANGKKRYVWLLKGKFIEADDQYKTKADKVDFQSEKISGKFLRRINDGMWKLTADEESTDFVATTATNWFTAATITVPAT